MSQSRLSSFIEAWINVAIGYGINFVMNLLVLPFFGLHITLTQNLALGIPYTVVSVARSYMIRRWFNRYIHRAAARLAGEA